MNSLENVYYPYITITLATGFSLTVNAKDNKPDYFVSLKHTRYMDKANTAVITFSYVPMDDDPNKLETEIAKSKGLVQFQYGYVGGSTSYIYKGLIYDYDVSVSDGTLNYTMQVVSQAVLANYTVLSDKSAEKSDKTQNEPDTDWRNAYKKLNISYTDNGNTYYQLSKDSYVLTPYAKLTEKPKDWDNSWSNYYKQVGSGKSIKYVSISSKSSSESNDGIYNIENKDTAEVICTKFSNLVKDKLPDYNFNKDISLKSLGGLSVESAKEKSCNGYTPIVYMQDVLRNLVDKSDLDSEGRTLQPKTKMYKLIVDDSKNSSSKGEIYIVLVDSSNVDAVFSFEWGTRNSDIISWSPNYKGSYAIFKGRGGNELETSPIHTSTDGTFEGIKVDSSKVVNSLDPTTSGFPYNTEGDSFVSDIIQDIETFRENADYCYTAKLEVLGVAGNKANKLRLGESAVEVIPLINGKTHHSAGTYIVKGITDNINSSGFTTEFDLYRSVKRSSDTNDTSDTYGKAKSEHLASIKGRYTK